MSIFALELDEACRKRQITVFFDYGDNTVYFGDAENTGLRFCARMPRDFCVEYVPARQWRDNHAVIVPNTSLTTMRALIESSSRKTSERRAAGEQCDFATQFHARIQRLLGTTN
jgi:hypothetical protein